mgnify:CR=1 FL=1
MEEARIDKLFHVLGGVSICFSAAGVLWHLAHRKVIALQDVQVLRALVFGFVCFAVINWEIYEYIIIEHERMTYSDTITDMICGLIGGLVAIIFVRPIVGLIDVDAKGGFRIG